MSKSKKATTKSNKPELGDDIIIPGAGVVVETGITQTLEENYMPYAMSVIVSRALPEIDGFKPSHRKLLYTMYDMGLLKGNRTKSANIVGATMHLNPHGDAAIYDTMVRLAKGNESLLVPYVDSKGNFGKAYSRDMASAASRYTEARLQPVCEELFRDIDKDTVEFAPNYDATTTEPTLLPVTFPTILANNTLGIAVGMASNICSFNLNELCETTIRLIEDDTHDLLSTLPSPDFRGGGFIVHNEEQLRTIYDSGRGSVEVMAKWRAVGKDMIEITEIPPTTTAEAIIDRITDLVKDDRIKDINDIRDETDLSGLKITIDLKRGRDAEKLMPQLFHLTTLRDSFHCNFNILINGMPRVMGVREILQEWVLFRTECVRRRVQFELAGKKERLHLLQGLTAILMDIDEAIRIIRGTDEETEVVPNLMIGFGIDKTQADYVAEIRLRHLNREYLLRRTNEIEKLEAEIAELKAVLSDPAKVEAIIIEELRHVQKTYGEDRRSEIIYDGVEEWEPEDEDAIEDYDVVLFFTKEGYFKKQTPHSLRLSGEQRLKEGDEIMVQQNSTNAAELLFFTNQHQVYKCQVGDFEDGKASVIGDYVSAFLEMDKDEVPLYMIQTTDYSEFLMFVFENGKVARVPLTSYETKQNRRRLLNAYSDRSPLVWMGAFSDEEEIALFTSANRLLVISTTQVNEIMSTTTVGVNGITLRKGQHITSVQLADKLKLQDPHRYRVRNLPALGGVLKGKDLSEQMSFLDSAP